MATRRDTTPRDAVGLATLDAWRYCVRVMAKWRGLSAGQNMATKWPYLSRYFCTARARGQKGTRAAVTHKYKHGGKRRRLDCYRTTAKAAA